MKRPYSLFRVPILPEIPCRPPALPAVAILGADSPIGLTLVREMGERGVRVIAVGTQKHALGRYSRYTSGFALMPDVLEGWLQRFVREHGVGAVLAVSEHRLIELAALKGMVDGCSLLCPDADKLALVLDKLSTLRIAAELGLDVPRSWLPRADEDFAERSAALSYPVAIKWADPNAVAPMLEAHALELEKVCYAAGPDELLAILGRYNALGTWPLVQTWCPGHGLGQMLNMHDGAATLRFQHRRLREYPPSGGISSFSEAVPLDQHGAQMELSERLLRAIGWEGPAMVEYRHDPETGKYWLMEVNGRFWGSIPLAWHCGAHFAWEAYRCQVLGTNRAEQPCPRIRRARYAIPDAKHLFAVLRDGRRPLLQRIGIAIGFIADFFDPRVRYYIWWIRDPKPFFSDLAGVFRKLLFREKSAHLETPGPA